MNKLMNKIEDYDLEVSKGFVAANQNSLCFPKGDLSQVVRKQKPKQSEVAIIGVCDGGHLPAFAGFVGEGMLHGAVTGKTMEVPSVQDIYEVINQSNMGKGCILIPLIWNEELNQNIAHAISLAKQDEIMVEVAEIRDDCMQPRNDVTIRKSSAGVFYACKIAGGAAKDGKDMSQIINILKKLNDNMRTAANICSSFCLPSTHEPFSKFPENMMEVGVGIHGENGFEIVEFPPAYTVAEHLFRHRINKELNVQPNEEISIMINDLGSATLDELYIIYQEEARQFESKGAKIIQPFVGRYVTTLDTDGVSITALRLDKETKKYLLSPSKTPFVHM